MSIPTTRSKHPADKYQKPKTEKGFKDPVRWLLGPQLLASLKYVALYAAFKGKLDPRDWMRAQPILLDQQPRLNTAEEAANDEYWFDYLADTGDGQLATYSIVYLCLSDLWVEDNIQVGSEIELSNASESLTKLPRGEFLFVGGDTGYHMADYSTLALRFQAPFKWAYEDLKSEKKISNESPRRPLLGIPGNHDYYDAIDGFGRQFVKPTSEEEIENREGLKPQLSILGFERQQSASYVALRLPFDWWFWGLDNEIGRMDIRQQEFFKRLVPKRPNKLIVATPEPTTVRGKVASPDGKAAKAFADLKLEQPFLLNEALPPGICRLDLSGDTHNYERYWGPSSNASAPSAENYASVVSGLGGAFLHPSDNDFGEIKDQIRYPSEKVSRVEVARKLFNPVNIIDGGYIAIYGAVIAAVIFFGSTVPKGSQVVVEALLQALGVSGVQLIDSPNFLPLIEWPHRNLSQAAGLSALAILVRVLSLMTSVVFVAASVHQSKSMVDSTRNVNKFRRHRIRATMFLISSLALLVFGVWQLVEYRVNLSPFQSSLLILFSLVWSATAIAASFVYSEFLFKQAYTEIVHWWNYWPVVLLVVVGITFPSVGLALFGKYPAIYVFADVIFASLVLGGAAAVIIAAAVAGGELHGLTGKMGFLILGAWHALLQGAVPFLLAWRGDWRSWIAVVAAVVVFWVTGNLLVSKLNARRSLAVAWVVYGLILISLPLALHGQTVPVLDRWITRLFVALLFGCLMSCVSLGWYFAVALAFNGHCDQAGGAARIQRFKEFMRIRLKADRLTAYVIGIDDPKMNGSELRPRIIDCFELKA